MKNRRVFLVASSAIIIFLLIGSPAIIDLLDGHFGLFDGFKTAGIQNARSLGAPILAKVGEEIKIDLPSDTQYSEGAFQEIIYYNKKKYDLGADSALRSLATSFLKEEQIYTLNNIKYYFFNNSDKPYKLLISEEGTIFIIEDSIYKNINTDNFESELGTNGKYLATGTIINTKLLDQLRSGEALYNALNPKKFDYELTPILVEGKITGFTFKANSRFTPEEDVNIFEKEESNRLEDLTIFVPMIIYFGQKGEISEPRYDLGNIESNKEASVKVYLNIPMKRLQEKNSATSISCGNNIIEPLEACDDGGIEDDKGLPVPFSGDGCSSTCTSEFCGNGVINKEKNEECDPGQNIDPNCDDKCKKINNDEDRNIGSSSPCGNGDIDSYKDDNGSQITEECDDENQIAGDGCDNCEIEAIGAAQFCGNRIVDTGEACDDGNGDNSDQCTNDCTLNTGDHEETETPTLFSTEVPTETPTLIYTEVPTETPTLISIEVPTEIPTLIYTEVPTEIPTLISTEVPTETPTLISTEVPTETPTLISTEVPTEIPTLIYTEVPTETPTLISIEVPTEIPTLIYTEVPTETPTLISIEVPTETPTLISTEVPTETPTTDPSLKNKCYYCFHQEVGSAGTTERQANTWLNHCEYWLEQQPNQVDGYKVVKEKLPFKKRDDIPAVLKCLDCANISVEIIGHTEFDPAQGGVCPSDLKMFCAMAENPICEVCQINDLGCEGYKIAYSDIPKFQSIIRQAQEKMKECGKKLTWSISGNQSTAGIFDEEDKGKECGSVDDAGLSKVTVNICIDKYTVGFSDCKKLTDTCRIPSSATCYIDGVKYQQTCVLKQGCTADGCSKTPYGSRCCPPGTWGSAVRTYNACPSSSP